MANLQVFCCAYHFLPVITCYCVALGGTGVDVADAAAGEVGMSSLGAVVQPSSLMEADSWTKNLSK